MKTAPQQKLFFATLLAQAVMCIALKPAQEKIRVVSDQTDIFGTVGVPIQYWYNETTGDGHSSSPGCPQSVDGLPWVYHGNPPKCFLTGLHGPCKDGERITLQRHSLYGICACECFVQNEANNLQLPQKSDRYLFCGEHGPDVMVPVFDKESQKCYQTLTQGPCKNGEVIGKWTGRLLTCLQECHLAGDDWEAKEKNELCTVVPAAKFALTDHIAPSPSECLEGKRWSERLKTCLLKAPKYRKGVIG